MGKCYYLIEQPYLPWNEANEQCMALDPDSKATLTSVRSQEEDNFILENVMSDTLLYWIGGTAECPEGIWRWVEDGSLVEENGFYTNWDEGQPNTCTNADMQLGFSCMAKTISGEWRTNTCDISLPTVCSKPIATAA